MWSQSGKQCRSFMAAGILGSVILVKDSGNLISKMWSVENEPGIILPLSRPLTSYHSFYLCSLETASRQKSPQFSVCPGWGKTQKTGAVCYRVTARTVMPLTGEPFLTLNGSKTVSASSLCARLCLASCIYCGRECCPCCSLNNDVLSTNTSRTLNSFSWQEQSQWDRLCCKI